MQGPSVKELMEELEATRSQATLVRMIMDHDLDPLDFTETRNWSRACLFRPSRVELKMSALNEVLDGHGTTWVKGNYISDYWGQIRFIYIDLADPYIPTLAYDPLNQTFLIASAAELKDQAEQGG
jgi:hypothetical protein